MASHKAGGDTGFGEAEALKNAQNERINKLHELTRLFRDTEALYTQLCVFKDVLEVDEYKQTIQIFAVAGERKHREAVNAVHELLKRQPSTETLDFANSTERAICANVARIHLARIEMDKVGQ